MILLLDGHAFIHRAFHALPEMSTERGTLYNAVDGFTRMVNEYACAYRPTSITCVFDSGGTSWRRDLYPAYKAGRGPGIAPLRRQVQPVIDRANRMGLLTLMSYPGEADDKIGRLVDTTSEDVLIVSGDNDFAQLVDARVHLLPLYDPRPMGPAEVEAKFGVTPARIPFLKALVGDSSDGYKGILGVGPVAARKLMTRFDSLDDLYGSLHLDGLGLSQRTQRAVLAGETEARLCYRLAYLTREADEYDALTDAVPWPGERAWGPPPDQSPAYDRKDGWPRHGWYAMDGRTVLLHADGTYATVRRQFQSAQDLTIEPWGEAERALPGGVAAYWSARRL